MNKEFTTSLYNKHLEIHYNEMEARGKNGEKFHIDLQGKIRCPVLNTSISHTTCCKLMDRQDWPRAIDVNCCKKQNCYIYLSIKKFQTDKKVKEIPNEKETKN